MPLLAISGCAQSGAGQTQLQVRPLGTSSTRTKDPSGRRPKISPAPKPAKGRWSIYPSGVGIDVDSEPIQNLACGIRLRIRANPRRSEHPWFTKADVRSSRESRSVSVGYRASSSHASQRGCPPGALSPRPGSISVEIGTSPQSAYFRIGCRGDVPSAGPALGSLTVCFFFQSLKCPVYQSAI